MFCIAIIDLNQGNMRGIEVPTGKMRSILHRSMEKDMCKKSH